MYPPERVMLVLGALSIGREFIIIDDERGFVEVDKDVLFEVTNDELDELKARGWVQVSDDGSDLGVTESGRYWSKRYENRKQTA